MATTICTRETLLALPICAFPGCCKWVAHVRGIPHSSMCFAHRDQQSPEVKLDLKRRRKSLHNARSYAKYRASAAAASAAEEVADAAVAAPAASAAVPAVAPAAALTPAAGVSGSGMSVAPRGGEQHTAAPATSLDHYFVMVRAPLQPPPVSPAGSNALPRASLSRAPRPRTTRPWT